MSKRRNVKHADTSAGTGKNSEKGTGRKKSQGKTAASDAVVAAAAEAEAAAVADKTAALAASSRKAIARATPAIASASKPGAAKSQRAKTLEKTGAGEPAGSGQSGGRPDGSSASAAKDKPEQGSIAGQSSEESTGNTVAADTAPAPPPPVETASATKPGAAEAEAETRGGEPVMEHDPEPVRATEPAQADGPALGAFAASERVQAYRQLMIDAAKADFDFNMALGTRLATMRSPFELFTVAAEFSGRRFGMINDFSRAVVDLATGRRPKT